MYRAALLALTASLAFAPKMCATKQQKPPEAEPPPPPPPVPLTSATTPPIWSPPDDGAPTTTAASAAPPPSTELVKARAAADAKEYKKVKALLDKRVRSGKGVPEESQLLYRACVQLKDKACAEAVKAKHPDDLTE